MLKRKRVVITERQERGSAKKKVDVGEGSAKREGENKEGASESFCEATGGKGCRSGKTAWNHEQKEGRMLRGWKNNSRGVVQEVGAEGNV